MKKVFSLFFFFLLSISGFSQSYLGNISKQVNLREGPGSDFEIIKSLKPGTQIFISSLATDDDFYNIVDIESDIEGYVHKSYVKVGKIVSRSSGGMFNPEGESEQYKPEISIYNNTRKTLTLKLNSEIYYFSPKETKKISLEPGECDFRASAPGVIPNIGSEYLDGNRRYSWQFYISTRKK
jgi:uncharacterized protein YgiM (DUF1202 family)